MARGGVGAAGFTLRREGDGFTPPRRLALMTFIFRITDESVEVRNNRRNGQSAGPFFRKFLPRQHSCRARRDNLFLLMERGSLLVEASAFFEGGSLGYSVTRDGGRLDGLLLRTLD